MTLGGQQLPFARDLREAIGIYARRRWPTDTTGNAARAWEISKATAKNVLKGHASDTTITHILRVGGWSLAIAVVGATIGERLEDFIQAERRALEQEAQQREREARELATIEATLFRRPVADVGAGSAPRGARVHVAHRSEVEALGGAEAGQGRLTDEAR